MKALDLNKLNVQEMNSPEMETVNGGTDNLSIIGIEVVMNFLLYTNPITGPILLANKVVDAVKKAIS